MQRIPRLRPCFIPGVSGVGSLMLSVRRHADMGDVPTNRWFGVRAIYLFGKKKDGTNIFEERIVAISASTIEEALAKAKREADEYAAALKMERHPWLEGYEQDGDALIDGYEVWSNLYESSEDLRSFVESRYGKYEYHPDE